MILKSSKHFINKMQAFERSSHWQGKINRYSEIYKGLRCEASSIGMQVNIHSDIWSSIDTKIFEMLAVRVWCTIATWNTLERRSWIILFLQYLSFIRMCILPNVFLEETRDQSLCAQPISIRKAQSRKKPINLCALRRNVSAMFHNHKIFCV